MSFEPIRGNQSFGVVNSNFSGNISGTVNTNNTITTNLNSKIENITVESPATYNIPTDGSATLKKVVGYTPNDFIGSPTADVTVLAGIPLFYLLNQPNLEAATNLSDERVIKFSVTSGTSTIRILKAIVEKVYTQTHVPGTITKIGPGGDGAGTVTVSNLAITLGTAQLETSAAFTAANAPTNIIRAMAAGENGLEPIFQVASNANFNLMGGGVVEGCTRLAATDTDTPGRLASNTNGFTGGQTNVGSVGISAYDDANQLGSENVFSVTDTTPRALIIGAGNSANPAQTDPVTGPGCALKVSVFYLESFA